MFENNIFNVGPQGFTKLALDIFHHQSRFNRVYKAYIDQLGINTQRVRFLNEIPFLPIEFFKNHAVKTGEFGAELFFQSSGTTQSQVSRHYVRDAALYHRSFYTGFKWFYGEPREWCIIGLLPSYLENEHSSLVYMVKELINLSGHPKSGFYLFNAAGLSSVLRQLEKGNQKTLLIGVTYALLDLANEFPTKLQHTVVMETGGMKGRREEITRPEVHHVLMDNLGITTVHSEYGMTELLSQAYSAGAGIFHCVPWMRMLVRHEDDPLDVSPKGGGLLNVIDLANWHSCSFIATDDMGEVHEDLSFDVVGRRDGSDLRGCNLLIPQREQ